MIYGTVRWTDMSMTRRFSETGAYSLLQICTWSFYSILLSFSGNMLRHFGFSDSKISLFLGSAAVLSLCVQLLVGTLSGKYPNLQVSNIIIGIGIAIILGCIVVKNGGTPVHASIAAYGVCCVTVHLIPPLANGVGMDAIRRGSVTNYSIARGIGSLGYSIFALITGRMVQSHGVMAIPAVGIVSACILIFGVIVYKHVCVNKLPPHTVESVQAGKKAKRDAGFLKKHPGFLLFLVSSFLLQLSHAIINNFMFQIVQHKGGTAAMQGAAAAVCAISEIPVIFLFPLLLKKLRCGSWLKLSALGLTLKPIGTLLASSPGTFYLAMATQLLGYGLFAISAVNYAEDMVGKGESVQAQSYFGAATTSGTIVALFTGGVICQHLGVNAMLMISLALAVCGTVYMFRSAQHSEA